MVKELKKKSADTNVLPLLYAYQLQAQVLVKHHTYINFHFIAIIVDDDDVVDVYAQCKYDDSLRELCYVSENYLHKNVEEKKVNEHIPKKKTKTVLNCWKFHLIHNLMHKYVSLL